MINGIGSSTSSLLGTALSGAQRTDAASRTTTAKTGGTTASTIIAQMAADGAPVDIDRVGALRAAIKAGTYKVDPEAIASKMVDLDITGTSL